MAKQKNKALEFMTGKVMSKYKEQFSEYLFLKDIMLAAAQAEVMLAVARSDFDAFGFDLLLSKHNVGGNWHNLRIQLKSTFKAKHWDVHKSLLQDESGRVIIIELSADEDSIVPKYFMFNKKWVATALARPPKVAHEDKCQVRIVGDEFINITSMLLSIFD